MDKTKVIELPSEEEISQVCADFLHKFGKTHQIKKLAEEVAELNMALIRLIGSPLNKKLAENVIEELADVEIMLRQARMIWGSRDIESWTAFKVERMKGLLK